MNPLMRLLITLTLLVWLSGGCPRTEPNQTGDNSATANENADSSAANENCASDADPATWNELVLASGIQTGSYVGDLLVTSLSRNQLPDGTFELTDVSTTFQITLVLADNGRLEVRMRETAANIEEVYVFDDGIATRDGTVLEPFPGPGFIQEVGLYAGEGVIRAYWNTANRAANTRYAWEIRRRADGTLELGFTRIGGANPPSCCPSRSQAAGLAILSPVPS